MASALSQQIQDKVLRAVSHRQCGVVVGLSWFFPNRSHSTVEREANLTAEALGEQSEQGVVSVLWRAIHSCHSPSPGTGIRFLSISTRGPSLGDVCRMEAVVGKVAPQRMKQNRRPIYRTGRCHTVEATCRNLKVALALAPPPMQDIVVLWACYFW